MEVDVRGLLLNAADALDSAADEADRREDEDWLYQRQPRMLAFALREVAGQLKVSGDGAAFEALVGRVT